ncbi:mitochondrial carrier protein, putative [Cordyceps militaris CM01]|uniref:Mitochondrial carrier protein, putative n=1 Tax=Cordyceps militaris (strain CM01) TaxID=983644 RepID=G3JM46_CORMM|nr:mitochondrial carrier protein, putative [Cordyceps militaris CM01]EGX90770.1 mitochondrial carrier protein, putative [Cordyceps militaris CM01]
MPLGFKALGFEAPDPSATATAASSPLPGLPSDARDEGQPPRHLTDPGNGGLVSTDSMSPEQDLDIEGRPPYSHAMLAGGIGGAFGDMLMHSLDTVKTRQQGDPNVPSKYRSLTSSYYTILRQEGIRRGLYGGWIPALSGSFPGTVLFFGTYEWSKRFLIDHGLQHHLAYLSAGFLGDLAASIVYVPSEVLKTRLQLQGKYNNPHFNSGYNYRGTVDAARTIVRTEGPAAMFHGYKATLYRDLPFSALQFMFYEQFQTWARQQQQSRDIGVGYELLTGATAGGLAGVITCPLDVVKTRLQTQVNPSALKNTSAHAKDPNPQKRSISTSSPSTHRPRPGAIPLETSSVITGLKVIYRTEGLEGWFRGVGPRGVWTFIQSGCMLFLYQRLLRQFGVWMPVDKEKDL